MLEVTASSITKEGIKCPHILFKLKKLRNPENVVDT
jgi:hypothetical protein